MYKKIFAILTILVFLMISISVISAESDAVFDGSGDNIQKTINVKVIWEDDGQTTDRPDSITVKLLCDGNVVDSVNLNESNSWKASFKITDDGNYEIEEINDISSYDVSMDGDADSGFVITNTIKEAPLKASADDDLSDEDSPDESDDAPEEEVSDNSSDEDSTIDNETDDSNQTEDQNNTMDENQTVDVSKAPTTTSNNEHKIVKKEDKPVKKNNTNTTENKLKNTGLPIVALVIVLIIVAFIPLSRRKK